MIIKSSFSEGVGGWVGIILVQVCEPIFQNLPHPYSYMAFEKTDPFIY